MTTPENISELVKGIIETQVIQALNSAPEAIEKLVRGQATASRTCRLGDARP